MHVDCVRSDSGTVGDTLMALDWLCHSVFVFCCCSGLLTWRIFVFFSVSEGCYSLSPQS